MKAIGGAQGDVVLVLVVMMMVIVIDDESRFCQRILAIMREMT